MSKKIIMAVIAFVVIIGGAVLATKLKSKTENYENQLSVTDQKSEKLYKDSDGDGLKDWEEELWGTNPNKADTDGDGVNDYEEIRTGHDPLTPGPNDLLATTTIAKKVNPQIESDLTETAKFSRELFAKFIAAEQAGDYKSVDYNSLLVEYAGKSSKGDTTIYKETNFKKTDTGKESIRAYGNALAKIFEEKSKQFPGSELQILDGAFNKEENRELTELDKPVARYSGIRDEMLTMTVPEGLLSLHTKMVNLFGLMAIGTDSMRFVMIDPVKAMGGTSIYPPAADLLLKSFSGLRSYFINQGVIFSKVESGYDFTKSI